MLRNTLTKSNIYRIEHEAGMFEGILWCRSTCYRKGPVYTEHQRQCCDVANSIALNKYLRFLNKLNQFIAARKWSCGKVMFYTCLSVILFTGGVSQHAMGRADTPSQTPPPPGRPPLGRYPPRKTPPRQTPPRWRLKRPVCILLECILVMDCNHRRLV